ncbi:hypothetical protein [Burkholderia anthina]|uniref:hypothetical protein n=1 Tax=Burkholderia anthina TaxID=179879 RepID=UPI00158CFE3E|nr:hypothetical protein [Burkholderia anthina]
MTGSRDAYPCLTGDGGKSVAGRRDIFSALRRERQPCCLLSGDDENSPDHALHVLPRIAKHDVAIRRRDADFVLSVRFRS